MAGKRNSATLFIAQISNHLEELAALLAIRPQEPIESDRMERSILSTNMLSNSASLLELQSWARCLTHFGSLLGTYRERSLPWDERVAQLTSELIEREEELVTEVQSAPQGGFGEVAAAIELDPIISELEALHSIARTMTPPPEPAAVAGVPASAERVELPLGRSIDDLRQCAQSLLTRWNEYEWDLTGGEDFSEVRRELFLINFHAQTIERIIGIKTDDQSVVSMDSLVPVRSAIEDFSRVLCVGTQRRIDISFTDEDHAIDARLLFPVVNMLQLMIGDVFDRCDDEYLHIAISVEQRHGHLLWCLRDNGNNFLSDSPFDRDEFLAFYPGLKETSRILSEMKSILWVEPDQNRDTRFAFTIPTSPEGGRFMVWGKGNARFAAHAHQISGVLPVEKVETGSDANGDFVLMQGKRVPLLRLGQLFSGAPNDGDRIAVMGSLEKRIALYVTGEGRLQDGEWVKTAISPWRGMDHGVAAIDDDKLPLIEAGGLVRRFLDIMNTGDVKAASTGAEDDSKVVPINSDKEKAIDVLVVEGSEALRKEYEAIFSTHGVSATIVEEVDHALRSIGSRLPTVIISEFRRPSMAAKALVTHLNEKQWQVPVLVSTTQTGQNAELLVQRLGAAGYVSKPLNPGELVRRVHEAARGSVASDARG